MQRSLIGISSLLFSSFLFAVPAGAANLPQCAAPDGTTEFVLIADDNIIFEPQTLQNPPRIIQGNVLVTSLHPLGGTFGNTGNGFVKVGANTNIQGTVIADVIILPDGGATIGACIANTIIGSAVALSKGSCKNLPTPTPAAPAAPFTFNTYAAAHPACVEAPLGTLTTFPSLCGATPVVAACANAAGPLTVANGGTLTLPPAPAPFPPDTTCFGALVLEDGAVLNLGTGPWTFKSVKMKAGSKLIGPVGGATVNVNGKFETDPGVSITNIDLNIAFNTTAEVATIQKNSTLTNVNINAPFGKCHIWTGTAFTCSEACCKVLDVEPITAECQPDVDICVCPEGFVFGVDPNTTTPENQAARLCVRP
jgi:hypothetical protein